MARDSDRRRFLTTAAAGGALAGAGNLAFLASLPPANAAETELRARAVGFDPDIEPLVRLLEQTSRDKLLDQ